jgi:hypothetical protein
MTGTPLGACRIDLGLDFFRSEGRLVQGIELFEGFPEPLGGGIAHALLARFEEVHEILHLCTLFGRQRLQLLDQGASAAWAFIGITPVGRVQCGSIGWPKQAGGFSGSSDSRPQ